MVIPVGVEREEYLDKIRTLMPIDPGQFVDNSLMGNISYMRQQNALDALCVMDALKHLDDFSDLEALKTVDIGRAKKILLDNYAKQKCAIEEISLSLPMRKGDVLRLHGQNSIEVYQSEGTNLEIVAEKVSWAETQEEAEAEVQNIEVWTFFEGDRIWLRDSRVRNLLGWPVVNLKIFIPEGAGIVNNPHSPSVAGSCDSVVIKDADVRIGVATTHSFFAENVTGSLNVDARSGNVSITNLNGTAEIEAICGSVDIKNSCADVKIRSVLGDVTCNNLSGSCHAKLIQGSLNMDKICTSRVALSTKNGKIGFSGVLMGGGFYEVKSKSGDINILLDDRSDCGFTAESQTGNINEKAFAYKEEGGDSETAPNVVNLSFLRGSGWMNVMSKSGNITVDLLKDRIQ